ncbi:MAG TPA: HAMP domain-containing sensor histidine kinase [Pseudolabrys sp.]
MSISNERTCDRPRDMRASPQCGQSLMPFGAIEPHRQCAGASKVELYEMARFLAGVSHDILAPVTRMKLRIETSQPFLGMEKFQRDLDEIELLIKESLRLAQSGHRPHASATQLDLEIFIEGLARDYQETGRAVTASGAIVGMVATRPLLLRRILTNLIDNALKYAGSAQIAIESDGSDRVLINVLDSGEGIPEQHLAEIVRPFVQLTERAQTDAAGVGLGLAIARELSQALSGSLSLRNRVSGGLAAVLCIPRELTSATPD